MTREDGTKTVRTRRALDAVPTYGAGRPATVQAGVTSYKISSNENPYPPLPSVLDAARDAVGDMNRYPDAGMLQLREAIAAHVGVSADEIVVGAGSSGVLGQIFAAVVEEDDEVLFAWRSFELYPIYSGLAGARSVQVPLTVDGRHDLEAMGRAVRSATSLVVVCSPNNPTGPVVHADELTRFLAQVPADVLVVLDEAYVEFVVDDEAPDAMALYAAHPNLVVLRTFSKAYGLAGLRVGYAIAHPPVADALRTTGMPFAVTTTGQVAALASLAAAPELEVRVKELVGERDRVVDALRSQGWAVPDTQANFVWLPLGVEAVDFADAADAAGLAVRPFAGDGVRCSIDVREANDRLIEVAARWRQRGSRPSPTR